MPIPGVGQYLMVQANREAVDSKNQFTNILRMMVAKRQHEEDQAKAEARWNATMGLKQKSEAAKEEQFGQNLAEKVAGRLQKGTQFEEGLGVRKEGIALSHEDRQAANALRGQTLEETTRSHKAGEVLRGQAISETAKRNVAATRPANTEGSSHQTPPKRPDSEKLPTQEDILRQAMTTDPVTGEKYINQNMLIQIERLAPGTLARVGLTARNPSTGVSYGAGAKSAASRPVSATKKQAVASQPASQPDREQLQEGQYLNYSLGDQTYQSPKHVEDMNKAELNAFIKDMPREHQIYFFGAWKKAQANAK